MPAPKRYMNSKDIAGFIGMTRRTAQNIMCVFEIKGWTITRGRMKLVSVKHFAQWLSEQDNAGEYKDTERQVLEYLNAAA